MRSPVPLASVHAVPFLALFVASWLVSPVHAAPLPFVNEVIDSVNNVGCYTDIEVDAQGNPHAIYIDLSNLTVRYAVRIGGVWRNELVDPVFGCTSLALDSKGNPHVSYDDSALQTLKYARKINGTWIIETVVGSGVAHETAIAVDANDEAHIAYQTSSTFDVRWAWRRNGVWQNELVDATGIAGINIGIAVDRSGIPRIAYSRSVGVGENRLLYAERLNGNWAIQQVDSVAPGTGVGSFCMIALDSRGDPHISHAQSGVPNKLRYTHRSGSNWTTEVVSATGGNNSSIAVDANDVPHISYQEYPPALDLMYASRVGGTWQVQAVDVTGDVGAETGIAVDRQGNVHITHYDLSNGNFKYATSAVYLKSPLGGERWPAGSQQTVYWGGPGPVDVLLSTDGGLTYDPVAAGVGSGSVTITVPAVTTERARIKIARSSPYSTAESPGYFQIAPDLASPWYRNTVDTPGITGTFTSLALNAHGNPCISYNYGSGIDLRYATRSGGTWVVETVDALGNVGQYTSLALDTQGFPQVAYYDLTNQDLRFASKSSGTWTSIKVDSTDSVGRYASLGLDAAGAPHVAYNDLTNGDLKYATRPGSSWTIERPDTTGSVGTYSSLALDGLGRPHVSYYDATNGNLKYARRHYVWTSETVDTVGTVGQYTSIRVDREGNPHISYVDATNQALKYAVKRNGEWTIERVDRAVTSMTYNSLAIAGDGTPRIAYYRDLTLRYASRIGGLWKIDTVDPTSSAGLYVSLALDPQGQAHMSYYDASTFDLGYSSSAVAVTSPRPGESWAAGARRTVTWDGTGDVDLWLSTDGGDTYDLLATAIKGGSYRLTVPYAPSSYCKLKLERQVPNSVAVTDSFFTIESTVMLIAFAVRAAPPGEDGVVVAWSTQPGIDDLAGYHLERNGPGGDWREIVNLTRENSYRDREGGPATRYRLTAVNALGQQFPLGEAGLGISSPLAAWPLPYRGGRLILTFATYGGLGGGKGPAELTLFDVAGRLVLVIAQGDFEAGSHTAVWDGRDAQGQSVGPGLYFLRARSARQDQRLKVVVAR